MDFFHLQSCFEDMQIINKFYFIPLFSSTLLPQFSMKINFFAPLAILHDIKPICVSTTRKTNSKNQYLAISCPFGCSLGLRPFHRKRKHRRSIFNAAPARNPSSFLLPPPYPIRSIEKRSGVYPAVGPVKSHQDKAPYLKMESRCTGK